MSKSGFTFGDIVRGTLPLLKAQKSFEQCVHDILVKEGGAAGMKAIKEGLEKEGLDTSNLAAKLKKVSKVSQHKHGDYVLAGIGMLGK